jgi:hypothetical protein
VDRLGCPDRKSEYHRPVNDHPSALEGGMRYMPQSMGRFATEAATPPGSSSYQAISHQKLARRSGSPRSARLQNRT